MIIDSTLKIEAVLAAAVAANQPVVHVDYIDWNQEGIATPPQTFRVALNSTTDVTILAAPLQANNTRREPIRISIYNPDTASATVTVKTDDGTTERTLIRATMLTLESLHWEKGRGWYAVDVSGNEKTAFGNLTDWTNYTPTVTLVGGAGNTVPVYSTNTGRWMRVGKTVFVQVVLADDGGAEGAGTGIFTVALPVAVGASAPGSHYVPAGRAVNDTSRFMLYIDLAASATTASLAYWATSTSFPTLTGADQNNATRSVTLHFSYETD